VVADPALREVNYGAWEGLSESEITTGWADLWAARVADPYEVSPPEGESYRTLWNRLQPAWERIVAMHAGDTVAVVGHNGSLRVLVSHLLGAPLANARRLRVENCSLSRVEIKSDAAAATICYINDTCHLHNIEG
jgi:broad specificity phosphatase PhoE